MLWLILGCQPFQQPAEVTPGWLYLHGHGFAESQRCALNEAGELTCEPLHTPAVEAPRDVVRWDYDGDGELDLFAPEYAGVLSACSPSGGCAILEGAGWAEGTQVREIATGDLNGDGRDDAALTGLYTREAVYQEPAICWGAADPGSIRCEPMATGTTRAWGASLSDLDGDGRLDAIFGVFQVETWDELPRICLGAGGGGFDCAAWDALADSGQDSITYRVPAGDLDGDGDVDLVVSYQRVYAAELYWCERDPTLPWSAICRETPIHTIPIPQQYYEGTWRNRSPDDLALIDVEGDGDLDIVAISHDISGLLYLCENDGRGEFTCGDLLALSEGAWGPGRLSTGDLDGDGDVDLAVGGSNDDAAHNTATICLNEDGTLDCAEHRVEVPWLGLALIPAVIE